jgi:hypothetical protein
MGALNKIIYADYLQRTRSYAFLITLAVALYAAYSFMPAPNAAYSTMRVGQYIGVPNAAWYGYVTAMMTSIFICWAGFYLVNSNIQKDVDTGVGMIIATTAVSNFQYLLAKAWSNFLVLLSITGVVFLMSIALFLFRATGYPFQPMQFILPYLLITVPAIVLFSAIAVLAEVFLYRYTILMNVGFFFLFCALISGLTITKPVLDPMGVRPVTRAMQQTISSRYKDTANAISMGFNFSKKSDVKRFEFNGVEWTVPVILSRLAFICLAFALVFISSVFFHRFDIKESAKSPKKKKSKLAEIMPQVKPLQDIRLSALPPVVTSYRIAPFIKAELLMLYRKGPKWLWLVNIGGMMALIFAPLTIAHQMILPILWFLQVARWSDLATKEKTNRIHYFTFASYKPLTRLLPAQILAGIIVAIGLALPLLIRLLITQHLAAVLGIILGGILIVLCAVALGILSGGKKLFEILFFLFTYANLNKVPIADYFGGVNQGSNYFMLVFGLITLFTLMSFIWRKMEIRRL